LKSSECFTQLGQQWERRVTPCPLQLLCQERGASEEVVVEGVSLGRPATCGKGKELIASLRSPSLHHHLTVLLDTYRQVALLKSLLLRLSCKLGKRRRSV